MKTQYKWLPSEPTKEMIEAAYNGEIEFATLKSVYSITWDAAPETEETPLFYRVVLKNAKGVIHVQDCDFQPTEDDYDGEVLSVTPLYAHSQQKQKPLSDEVLTKLWVRSPVLGCTKREFIMLSRVIEEAHGIGDNL
jgi:hypothetical protein